MACHKDSEANVIYLLDTRLQKQVYDGFIRKCKANQLPVSTDLNVLTTKYIVSAFENIEDVISKLQLKHQDIVKNVFSRFQFVKPKWLSECLKNKKIVEVREDHKLSSKCGTSNDKCAKLEKPVVPEWSFMSSIPLKHHNAHLTDSLEVLEKEAAFRGEMGIDDNYARALAFRRCIATLKGLSFIVTKMEEIENLPRVGNHCKRVIKELLEDGICNEVEHIKSSDFYKKQELFSSVFGVGPKTAETWRLTHNIKSLEEACLCTKITSTQDQRLVHGLAFHKDLNKPVSKGEAIAVLNFIKHQLEDITPGLIVTLVGGFRRGKDTGHDIDILITHPEEGKEVGVLGKLLRKLDDENVLLYGKHETRRDTQEKLKEVPPGKEMASPHDEFEKYYGIIKLNENVSTDGVVFSSDDNKEFDSSRTDLTSNCKNLTHNNQFSPVQKKPKLSAASKINFSDVFKNASAKRKWIARRIDLVIAPISQYYYALVGWTGSKFYNRDLRLYATRVLKMRLSSHALWDMSARKFLQANNEQDVFENMGLTFKEPWERNA